MTPSAGPNGSIQPDTLEQVAERALLQFVVVADTGYRVAAVGGTCGGYFENDTYTTNPVIANCSVEATFEETLPQTYEVAPSSVGAGRITPSVDQNVEENSTVDFLLLPDPGYSIGSVGGTCGGFIVDNRYTTSVVTRDCSVVIATFVTADEFEDEEIVTLPLWLLIEATKEN